MYINTGGGKTANGKTMIGIFDMDSATVARTSKLFLQKRQKEGKIKWYAEDIPRSFILNEDNTVIMCDLNAKTIGSRAARSERKNNG